MSPSANTSSSSSSSSSSPPSINHQSSVMTLVPSLLPVPESVAKDAIIAWYRGEFAAANAIIDALCSHLKRCDSFEYEELFGAIYRRRLNWIPVIQMQKFFSIAELEGELRKVEENWKEEDRNVGGGDGDGDGDGEVESSPVSEVTEETGSQEAQATPEHTEICDDHEDCETRLEQIKLTKGFIAKEPVKGHMVNVVKGLRMYEDVFTTSELLKLNDLANELRIAGQNGELPGETYVLFNKNIKGNKREQIQLGVPVFGPITDEAAANVEPIPALLESVIDHLVQWRIMPENRRPNSSIINYFDEGEYSQPYLKPPHLDQPLCYLLLSESRIAFGLTLASDHDGNFKGQLSLSLKGGSVIVMRNNCVDIARHVMCPSPTRRISIMFFRVRPDMADGQSMAPLLTQAMTMWQPGIPSSPTAANGLPNGYAAMNMIQKNGVIGSPVVMLSPMPPVIMNPRRTTHGGPGTGVFLPWAVGSRNRARHLPPRAQKRRVLALSSNETHVSDTMSDPGMEMTKMT